MQTAQHKGRLDDVDVTGGRLSQHDRSQHEEGTGSRGPRPVQAGGATDPRYGQGAEGGGRDLDGSDQRLGTEEHQRPGQQQVPVPGVVGAAQVQRRRDHLSAQDPARSVRQVIAQCVVRVRGQHQSDQQLPSERERGQSDDRRFPGSLSQRQSRGAPSQPDIEPAPPGQKRHRDDGLDEMHRE